MVGTYHVKNEFGTDEYDVKTATKGNYEMGGGGGGLMASHPGLSCSKHG